MQKCEECGMLFAVVKAVVEPKEEAKGDHIVVTARCDTEQARFCPHCGKEL